MNLDRYPLKAEQSLMVFEFISEGPKGNIIKIIQYSETNLKGFYNLGFGDKDEISGDIVDNIITNNNDSQKVLATVASTVYAFTDKCRFLDLRYGLNKSSDPIVPDGNYQ